MRITKYLALCGLALLAAGCSKEATPPQEIKRITLTEVSNHATKADCWMAVGGKVYDLTKYVPIHPGMDSIVEGCGKDATTLFETRPMGTQTPHSENARQVLERFYIGDLIK